MLFIEKLKFIGYVACALTIGSLILTICTGGTVPFLIGVTIGFAICTVGSTIAIAIQQRRQ